MVSFETFFLKFFQTKRQQWTHFANFLYYCSKLALAGVVFSYQIKCQFWCVYRVCGSRLDFSCEAPQNYSRKRSPNSLCARSLKKLFPMLNTHSLPFSDHHSLRGDPERRVLLIWCVKLDLGLLHSLRIACASLSSRTWCYIIRNWHCDVDCAFANNLQSPSLYDFR